MTSGDDSLEKRGAGDRGWGRAAGAPAEYVGDFSSEIAKLGAQRFAIGMGSIELTSPEVWGHMG